MNITQNIGGMVAGLVETAAWIEGSKTNRRDLIGAVKRRLLSDQLLHEFKARLKELEVKYAVTPIEGAGGMVYVDINSMLTRGGKEDEGDFSIKAKGGDNE